MQKTTKVLGIISLLFSVFSVMILIQYLVESSSSSAGWADLGFFLITFIFIVIALILSVPFIVIGLKLKFKDMRFYTYAHLSFLILTVLSLVFSLL